MIEGSFKIDKVRARKAFSRAAGSYDKVAVLQREIGERMLERLELVRLDPAVILDVGAGTGLALPELSRRYPKARVVALDFAHSMLLRARKRGKWLRRRSCLCADLEQMPIRDQSVDLIYSNLTLQWSSDLPRAFSEFLRVLRPGGLLMFTTFGPDTLKELRAAWRRVDDDAHVSLFLDMHDLGDMLVRARFAEPVMDVDRITMTYADVAGLMRDLKVLGAHNAAAGRPRGLTGKARMRAMIKAYEEFRRNDCLPASYEVIFGHAWAPDQRIQGAAVTVPVESIARRRG